MIRLITGLLLVVSAVGGIEHFNLPITIGFFCGVLGLILMVLPINDGSLDKFVA